MVDDDGGLLGDGVLVVLDVPAELPLGSLGVELGVVVDALDHVEVPVDRRVVGQHVHDEAFLDGLLHRVVVERQVFHRAVRLRVRGPEELEGLVLGSGGERKVGGVGQEPPALDYPVDLVLEGVLVIVVRRGVPPAPLPRRWRFFHPGSNALRR